MKRVKKLPRNSNNISIEKFTFFTYSVLVQTERSHFKVHLKPFEFQKCWKRFTLHNWNSMSAMIAAAWELNVLLCDARIMGHHHHVVCDSCVGYIIDEHSSRWQDAPNWPSIAQRSHIHYLLSQLWRKWIQVCRHLKLQNSKTPRLWATRRYHSISGTLAL